MESIILETAVSQGIWAVLTVALLIYIAKSNDSRDARQEEREEKYQKLKNYWKRDSWCLCHGICGNLWILEIAEEFLGKEKTNYQKIVESSDIQLLPQETMNPGFWNGYGGILYYLIRKKNS